MKRKWLIRVSVLAVAAGLTAATIGAARRPWFVINYESVSLVIEDPPADTPPGFLAVRATGHVPVQPHDLAVCWYVEIRTTDVAQIHGQHEYVDEWFPVKKGSTADPTFFDRFPMPAGEYNVLVGLREGRPTMHEDGSITEHSPLFATSRLITVR